MSFVPGGKLHTVSSYRQLGEGSRQVGDAGALTRGGIQGQRQVGAFTQDRLHQSGQPVAGADFDEIGHPGRVHRLDFGHEFDRLGELGGQLRLGGRGVRRVGLGRGVGVNREQRRLHLDPIQGLQEGDCRIRHQ